MDLERKQQQPAELKLIDEDAGLVEMLVSITGVVDEVGDNIVPGAYTRTLSARNPKGVWSHDWSTPVGKTVEAEELMPGDSRLPAQQRDGSPWPQEAGALRIVGQFNLETQRGRDAFADVKFYGDETEWSIGFNVPAGAARREGGQRFIDAIDLFEWSPVLFGAAPLTVTQDIKQFPSDFPFDGMTECIDRMGEEPGVDDAEAFCASWYFQTYGEWPAESSEAAESPEAEDEKSGLQKALPEEFPYDSVTDCLNDISPIAGEAGISDPGAFCSMWYFQVFGVTPPDPEEEGKDVGGEGTPEPESEELEEKPWHIEARGGQHCVVNTETGEVEACHDAYEDALAQLQALYANYDQENAQEAATMTQAQESKIEVDVEGSYEQMLRQVIGALYEQEFDLFPGFPDAIVQATFPDRLLVDVLDMESGDITYYELPYFIGQNNTVEFGSPSAVELDVQVRPRSGVAQEPQGGPDPQVTVEQDTTGFVTAALKLLQPLDPTEQKAGRVLSERNAALLTEALSNIIAALSNAGFDTDELINAVREGAESASDDDEEEEPEPEEEETEEESSAPTPEETRAALTEMDLMELELHRIAADAGDDG